MDSLQAYFDEAQGVRTVTYFYVSASVLFMFDYIYQLEDELTFIWSRRDWTFGKVLYVVTRYIPFVLIPMTLASAFSPLPDVGTCHSMFYAITIVYLACIVFSELTFRVRAYAVCSKSRLVLIILCCTLAASLGLLAFICFQFLSSVSFGEPPISLIYGCYITSASYIFFGVFVIIMCSEAVTTYLTLYRAYRLFRYGPNVLVQNLMRDGAFYCLCMFAMSIANVLVIFLLPVPYSQVLIIYQGVMHTILATRAQLHLRKLHRSVRLPSPLSEGSVLPMGSFKQVDPLYA